MGIFHLLSRLKAWILQSAALPFAPAILFANAWAEAILFPVPPDLLLIAMCLAATAAGEGWLSFVWALICTAGSVTGGVTGYYIGLKGGRPIALKLYSADKINAADKLYEKYGVWAVAIAGFTPVPYCIFTVLSGVLRMKLLSFTIVSIFSRAARFFLVATMIFFFGEPVQKFLEDEKRFGIVTLIFMAGLIGGYVVVHMYSKRHAKRLAAKMAAEPVEEE